MRGPGCRFFSEFSRIRSQVFRPQLFLKLTTQDRLDCAKNKSVTAHLSIGGGRDGGGVLSFKTVKRFRERESESVAFLGR